MNRMDATRFEALADAHGAAIGRWPLAEQDAAFAYLAEAPEAAQALLDQARVLDEALDTLRPPSPSLALRDAVLSAAPRPKAGWSLGRWLAGAGVGAALAAACAAGVVIGVDIAAPSSATGLDAVSQTVAVEDDWFALPDMESQS
ncbi:MAG: hypothetical protein KF842_06005 [Caulobacter sp.]|nr:hypothetical protein [Caulobacter sp.]